MMNKNKRMEEERKALSKKLVKDKKNEQQNMTTKHTQNLLAQRSE